MAPNSLDLNAVEYAYMRSSELNQSSFISGMSERRPAMHNKYNTDNNSKVQELRA